MTPLASLASTAPVVRIGRSLHSLGAAAMVALSGAAALSAAWLVLSPTATEVLQAAVSAHDYSAARGVALVADNSASSGALRLLVDARIGDHDFDGALKLLDRTPETPAEQLVQRRLKIAVLSAAKRLPALQSELAALARQTGRAEDVRAVLTLATARGDTTGERAALASLVARRDASTAESERLANLERDAGRFDAARGELREILASGQQLSAGGVAMLLELSWRGAEPSEIAETMTALARQAASPSAALAVDALVAAGRPEAALMFAENIARSEPLALLGQRSELLRRAGRAGEARRLLALAIAAPSGTIATAEIIRMSFELDTVETLFAALESGRIDRLPPNLALDLARRALTAGRFAVIPRIDRVASGDWRQLDPWTAMQLARRGGDTAAALRYAAMLGGATGEIAQETILRETGDGPGLRKLWLARAASTPADRAKLAGELLDRGYKADSVALLSEAAAHSSLESAEFRRLSYVWGPRPPAAALAWLKLRAAGAADPVQRLAWLAYYADHAAPDAALAMLTAEPDADKSPMLLLQLDLARASGKVDAQRRIFEHLLDGRGLAPADLRRLQAAMSDAVPRAQRLEVQRRLLSVGQGTPQMQLDLAWDAFNQNRFDDARKLFTAYLEVRPSDAAALMQMAEIDKRLKDPRSAREWSRRALIAIGERPPSTAASELRAQILEQLGRTAEALEVVVALRRDHPEDDRLLAAQARLLIAAGRPAVARKLLGARAA